MGQTSSLGYVVRLNALSMTADRPVDTGRSWAVVNNAMHLYDEHFQHRLNWSASTATGDELVFSAGATALLVIATPWTIKANGMPANIDLAVACRTQTGEGLQTASANILYEGAHIQQDGSFTPSESYWGTSATRLSNQTAGWVIDTQKIFNEDTDRDAAILAQKSRRNFLVRDGTAQSLQNATVAFVKLHIKIAYSVTGTHAITGILLREFV